MEENKKLIDEISNTNDNIEIIENKIKNHILKNKPLSKFLEMAVITILLTTGITIPIVFLKTNLWIKVSGILGVLGISSLGITNILEDLKINKASKNIHNKSNEILKETMIKEETKLNNLIKEAQKKNLEIVETTHKVRSEVIKNLEKKLKLIELYEFNKTKILKFYNKGLMVEVMCMYDLNENDMKFIEELIKNDLINLEEKQNKNQKVKKLNR